MYAVRPDEKPLKRLMGFRERVSNFPRLEDPLKTSFEPFKAAVTFPAMKTGSPRLYVIV